MTRAIAWFAENRVAANLLMCLFVVGGCVMAPTMPQKTFPDIDIDWINISVAYPGAAPTEVEHGVCSRIEEEIYGVDGIEQMASTATEGMCAISVEVMAGQDADLAVGEIKNRIDGIRSLPDEAERPMVSKFVIKRTVLEIAVVGDADERTLKVLAEKLRDEIAALPGVTQADLDYVRSYEISIEVPEASLRRHGIGFDQVVRAVRRSSLDLPGGSIKTDGGEILLRATGQAYSAAELEEIVVLTRPDGTRVHLREIARVVDGFADRDISAEFDGKPAVMVRVFRLGDQDAIAISDAVKAHLASAREDLPDGIALVLWQDATDQLRGRLDTLFKNARTGLLLVFALLALFLRFRLAFWVAAGVPIAFLGALMVLPFFDVAIDSMSVFSFIVVLGIVVDDAIVVGENVYSHEARTGDRLRAAIEGTQEVAIPVIFGVLTTVAAFSPLVFVPGFMGQFFSVIGVVVIVCLLFSVVESQLVLPAHLSQGNPRREDRSEASGRETRFVERWRRFQAFFSTALERLANQTYQPFLKKVLAWRYVSVSIGTGVLILALGVVGSGRMQFTFFPPAQADHVAAAVTLPQGSPVARTRRAAAAIVASAEQLRDELDADRAGEGDSLVRHVLVSIGTQPFHGRRSSGGFFGGGSGSNLAEVVLELAPSQDRRIGAAEIAQRWRELTGDVPDATAISFKSDLFSAGEDINVQLHADELEDLERASARLQAALALYPGVSDISDSFEEGKQELKLSVLPQAELLGISMDDLARQVRQAFYGEEAQRIQRGREDVKVMVRYPAEERHSIGDLERMRIRTADGVEVPFSTVARAELGRGYTNVSRIDRQRIVNVTADIDTAVTTANRVVTDLRRGVLDEIVAEHPGMTVGMEGAQREQRRAFTGLAQLYLIALLAIYGLLAVPLRSYLQPLIIMSVIPFGAVGAVAGHIVMGRPFSFFSIIGMVALSGVVVNASLVMVDYVNRRRAEGASLREAVERAGVARFRPIVLTSITTFAGLTPLMLEQRLEAQMLIPMAISLAYGVMFATFITLLLVPCGYLILEDFARLRARLAPDGLGSLRGGLRRLRAGRDAPGREAA